jgi:hypothetical protein
MTPASAKLLRLLVGLIWISLATFGCSGSKKLVEPIPDWVLNRPNIPGYYIGVASADKSSNPTNAAEVAQRQALSELAGQIRVKIEAKSVLHTTQFQGIAGQNFSEEIQSSSAEDLEGYERVGFYETEEEVWTYYRLSKLEYKRIRNERKSAAMDKAGGFWTSAVSFRENRDVAQALDRYIRGLEALQDYWGEVNLWENPSSKTITLDRACLDGISDLIGSLEILGLDEPLVLDFSSRYTGTANCQIELDGGSVGQLPLTWRYHRGTLPRKVDSATDGSGKSEVRLEEFDAGLNQTELRVSIGLESLMPQLDHSPAAALIRNLVVPEKTCVIELPSPVIQIISKERKNGRPTGNALLRDALAQGLNKQGLQWVENERNADLILVLETDTRQAGEASGFFTAMLDGSVVIRTRDGEPVVQQNLNNIKGVQLNWEAAHAAAYTKAQKEIQETFIKKLVESLYQ